MTNGVGMLTTVSMWCAMADPGAGGNQGAFPSLSAQIKDWSVMCSNSKMKMDAVCIAIIYYFKLYLLW